MRKVVVVILSVFLCTFLFVNYNEALCATGQINVSYGETVKVNSNVGDKGKIVPTGKSTVVEWIFTSDDENIVKVDASTGEYQCLAVGQAEILVQGYDYSGSYIFVGYCDISINPDMSAVTLAKTSVSGLKPYGEEFSTKISIKGANADALSMVSFEYNASNTKMGISCWINDTYLYVNAAKGGSSTVTVKIGGKAFTIQVKVTEIAINKTCSVIKKGGKVTLKVKGTSKSVTWTSSNKKVATVSKKGVVKGKKYGNAIIKGKVDNSYFACVVSVVKARMLKVIKRAKYIGTNWKYSQPKRMTSGFYDCSSLVWKSYSYFKIDFGNANYAPVAADIAKYVAKNGKVLTNKYTQKQLQSLKFRPGDLMFEPGAKNGRYKGIYHVEMFIGYNIANIDEAGNVTVCERWGARVDGCYGGGYIMERPKY